MNRPAMQLSRQEAVDTRMKATLSKYRGADKSLARPTSPLILFVG